MSRQMSNSKTQLAKWLRKHDITMTQLSRDCDLAYRTVWLAVHGYRVSYETACLISDYTGGCVAPRLLCEARPRSEFVPTTG
jgi:hypothetical protein